MMDAALPYFGGMHEYYTISSSRRFIISVIYYYYLRFSIAHFWNASAL